MKVNQGKKQAFQFLKAVSLKGFAESTGTFKLLLVMTDVHSAKMKACVPFCLFP